MFDSVLVVSVCAGERVVDVGGTACPCGGTHVKKVADIIGITVTKIKKVCIVVCQCVMC